MAALVRMTDQQTWFLPSLELRSVGGKIICEHTGRPRAGCPMPATWLAGVNVSQAILAANPTSFPLTPPPCHHPACWTCLPALQACASCSASPQVLPPAEGGPRSSLAYKYIIHEDLLPLIGSNNVLLEETDTYEWALKSWAPCTKACGGGNDLSNHLAASWGEPRAFQGRNRSGGEGTITSA